MTQPRQNIVSVSDTPYYHCIGRCVRRAFLCGKDDFSGKSFEHRRQWIVDRINELSSAFSIDICAYAIMTIFCVLQKLHTLRPCKYRTTTILCFGYHRKNLNNGHKQR